MNTNDEASEVARREALGAAWTASAKPIRERLQAEAEHEYRHLGRRSTWDLAVGQVVLPVSKTEPYIRDIGELLKWVKAHHPEQVQTVEQVYAAFQKHLIENAVIVDGEPVDPTTGVVVDGMAVREGGQPRTLSFRFDSTVKREYAAWAEAEVARQLADEYGPQESSVSDPDGA